MRTTTVVWARDPNLPVDQNRTEEIYTDAANLAGELYRSEIQKVLSEDGTTVTMTRAWPDLDAAQAWVDLVLSKGAVSAQVNPE